MGKYSYKTEDYGGGATAYVIYKSGKAIFHSNGHPNKAMAITAAKLDIQSREYQDDF